MRNEFSTLTGEELGDVARIDFLSLRPLKALAGHWPWGTQGNAATRIYMCSGRPKKTI